MDLPSPIQKANNGDLRVNSPMSTTRKISQDTDSHSIVDSGIACERSDSTIENSVGDEGSRRERRTQRHVICPLEYKLRFKLLPYNLYKQVLTELGP